MVLEDVNHTSSESKVIPNELLKQHSIFIKSCCLTSECTRSILGTLMVFYSNFDDTMQALNKSIAIGLHEGLENSCSSLSSWFCLLKPLMPMVDKALTLPSLSSWKTKHKEDFLINSIILLKNYKLKYTPVPPIEPGEYHGQIHINNINLILHYIHTEDFDSDLSKYWPENYDYKPTETCGTSFVELFMQIVVQVRELIREVEMYNDPPKLGGKVRKVVNTEINFREYLVQKQLAIRS